MRSHRALFVSAILMNYTGMMHYLRKDYNSSSRLIRHLLLSPRVHYVRHVLGLCKSGHAHICQVRFKCRVSLHLVTWHRQHRNYYLNLMQI